MSNNCNFIFISGVERSGTTFLAKKICDYKNHFFVPEAQWKKYIISEKIHLIKDSFRFKIWGLIWKPSYDKLNGWKLYVEICRDYLMKNHDVDIHQLAKYTIVDHTPENFIYSSGLKKWPNIKYILIVRNSYSVSNSILKTDWYFWTLKKVVKYQQWRESRIFKAIANGSFNFEFIRYEDILHQRDTWIVFLNNNNLINKRNDGLKIKLPSYTYNQHKLVNKESNLDREFAWRNELNKKSINYLRKAKNRTTIRIPFVLHISNPYKFLLRFFKKVTNFKF